MKGFIRDLYLGENNYIESWSHYKRAILTGHLSMISALSSIFYVIYFTAQGVTSNFYIYIFLLVVACLSLFFVRIQKYRLAKVALLVATNIVVYYSLYVLRQDSGASIFFICCILAAFTLFGYEERVTGYFFTALSIGLFVLVTLSDVSDQQIQISQQGLYTTKVVNFIIAAVISVLMIRFLLKINVDSEKILRENEERLKVLNKELSESRRRFELAIQGLNAGMWDWNAVTDRIYVSPTLTHMLGYSLEEVYNIGKNAFFKIVHRDDIPVFEEAISRHYTTKQPFEVECRLLKKDGSFLEVLDTAQSEWDDEGNVVRMVGSVVDITDRKNVERRMIQQNVMLEKTNEELDRFVYIASHDLRAPLSSVLGLLKIAELSKDPDELKQCLEMMEERITTLNGFIRDIIDYSRNTRLDVSKDEINLDKLIDTTIEGLRYFEKSPSISFIKEVDADLIVHLDKGRLKIILNNLIGNAIKYHNIDQENPFVKVKAQAKNNRLIVEVEDNGMGISDEYQDKIFNMFFRASEQSEGSGLGLYITKEMADKLNGDIRVESKEKEGSKFIMQIPL